MGTVLERPIQVEKTMSSGMELSVILVPLSGGMNLDRALEALRQQSSSPTMEIIVPHDERMGKVSPVDCESHLVRILRVPGPASYAGLRAAGVRASRGRIIAITEDQCIPPPRWCANIVAAHRESHAAIGGPVEKQRPDSLLGWAIYLREFIGYIPPLKEGPSASLTDCNVSYKRAALEQVRDVWADAFHEPEVHAALRNGGEALWLSPALLTYQQRSLGLLPALAERYEFGRLYGSLRAGAISTGKRLLLTMGSIFLPAVLLARVIFVVVRKRRYLGACLAALPYLALFAAIWSWGEFLGYLTARPAAPR